MVTVEQVKKHIAKTEFKRMGEKTTICMLTTDFGMEVIGISHCQNPENFDIEIGQNSAYNDAFDRMFTLVLARSL